MQGAAGAAIVIAVVFLWYPAYITVGYLSGWRGHHVWGSFTRNMRWGVAGMIVVYAFVAFCLLAACAA
jgi:hypothetical protein